MASKRLEHSQISLKEPAGSTDGRGDQMEVGGELNHGDCTSILLKIEWTKCRAQAQKSRTSQCCLGII